MSLAQWIGSKITLFGSSSKFWASWGGKNTYAAETVTPERAMTLSAFNRGLRLIAETVATLPIDVYRTGSDGVARLVTDPANPYRAVLKISPNVDQTPVEFWEGMVGCMLLAGDGLARKSKLGSRLVAMTLMDPLKTDSIRQAPSFALQYRYRNPYGKTEILDASEVFQIKGFGFGGDRGMSCIQYGAQTISSSLAADKVAGKMFKAGLSSSGFIETQTTINETDRPRLEQVLQDYQGSDNAGKLMILEGGMKYTPVTMSAADAQLLQARGFNIEEIARWLGLPPVLLGHSGNGVTMWGTGVEQIIQAWYTLGLRALLTRIETAISKRVIEPADQGVYYVKFNVEGLLRGDSAARANFYSIMVQNGLMTRDEVRELEDLEKYTGGGSDKLTAQVNLTTIDQIGQAPAAGAATGQPAGSQAAAAIKAFLGIDEPVTRQDLFDLRREISNVKRRQDVADATVIEQPQPSLLEQHRDLRDR